MSKKICVYPHQCQFPNCNCDQPHKATKHPNTGVWPYISPSLGGVAGLPVSDRDVAAQYGTTPEPKSKTWQDSGYNPNPFGGSYTVFEGYRNVKQEAPVETPEANEPEPDTYRWLHKKIDDRIKEIETSKTVRERFVLYVGIKGLPRSVAKEHIAHVKSTVTANPSDDAIWYVLGDDTTSVSRIERLV